MDDKHIVDWRLALLAYRKVEHALVKWIRPVSSSD
jgi:hypothetical protein